MSDVLGSIFLAISALAPCTRAFAQADGIFADGFERPANALVFVMPFQAAAQPASGDVDFIARIGAVDMYVIIDRSGSMSMEITTVKNNLASVVNQLQCPPFGSGDPATCIANLWAGAGTVGYSGSGIDAYRNWVDVQPNPNFAALPTTEPGGCCMEPLNFSVFATITGSGGSPYGFPGVPARASCATSPAAAAGYATFGYPCFRQGALPLVLLATDEPPLSPGDTNKTPDWSTIVRPQMPARGARLIGILGSGFVAGTDTDLRRMATDTGAIDAGNGNAPLVFDGAGAGAASAIEQGVRAAASGLPLRLQAVVEDDPGDAIDAVAAFVSRIETLQLGTPLCTDGLATQDSNGDTFPDLYSAVRVGTGVCWRVVTKTNTTVPATTAWQSFRAMVRATADNSFPQGVRELYFMVPPQP